MTETIWYKDFKHFISINNLPKFIPTGDMSYAEKLNAIMRFSIYFSAVLYIVRRNILVWYFVVITAFGTMFMNEMYFKHKNLEKELYQKLNVMYDDKKKNYCMLPTKENPFMNVLVNEYKEFPNRPSACDINNKKINKKAEQYFDINLYRDVDDIFERNSSSRNWHTVPSTTIPNDRDSFANWLYKTGPTCKEKGGNCYNNVYHPLNV
jgi:hypothetical protein